LWKEKRSQGENSAKSSPLVQEPCVACAFAVYVIGHRCTDRRSDGRTDGKDQQNVERGVGNNLTPEEDLFLLSLRVEIPN
jgi:hypothetical protein